MPERDIERIFEKLESISREISEMQKQFAVHCAETKIPNWKTYMLFMAAGGLMAQGPASISILTKWLGIG